MKNDRHGNPLGLGDDVVLIGDVVADSHPQSLDVLVAIGGTQPPVRQESTLCLKADALSTSHRWVQSLGILALQPGLTTAPCNLDGVPASQTLGAAVPVIDADTSIVAAAMVVRHFTFAPLPDWSLDVIRYSAEGVELERFQMPVPMGEGDGSNMRADSQPQLLFAADELWGVEFAGDPATNLIGRIVLQFERPIFVPPQQPPPIGE